MINNSVSNNSRIRKTLAGIGIGAALFSTAFLAGTRAAEANILDDSANRPIVFGLMVSQYSEGDGEGPDGEFDGTGPDTTHDGNGDGGESHPPEADF